MTEVLQVGPLVLPTSAVIQIASVALAVALGQRAGRSAGVDAQPQLLRLVWIGLVAARLSFVWTWRSAYLDAPLTVLDLRDGGWDAVAGFAAASLVALHHAHQDHRLRRPLVVAVLVGLLGWAGAEAVRITSHDARGRLPALALVALDGSQVHLSELARRPVVLNLWATWCGPCRHEMPLLQQAQAAHPQVSFVFVDQGESRDEVARYLQDQGLVLAHVLIDPTRSLGAAFDARALPTTLFFDARGELVSTRIGMLSAATLAQRLDRIR
jgi:thiol-disulfide isomerase/thioredoxin